MAHILPDPPPYKPELDAIRWIEDPWHGPSRPRRPACRLIFWRPCPHRPLPEGTPGEPSGR